MTLSQIRRLFLGILAFLIACSGVLLFMVESADPCSELVGGEVMVVGFCADFAKAENLKASLAGSELQVQSSKVDYPVPVPDGYRLVIRGKMLDAVLQTLQFKNVYAQKCTIDGESVLTYGGVFQSKEQASKSATSIASASGIHFSVEVNTKKVKKPCMKLIVNRAPKGRAESIKKNMESAGFVGVQVKNIAGA